MRVGLLGELDARQEQELRDATRALLMRPLLHAERDPEAFRLVRRHVEELRRWFDAECGWSLVVEGDVARLRKRTTNVTDATRPARDPGPSRAPFSARRYVLVCLALAALERADLQITLGKLAADLLIAARDPRLETSGFVFALDRREQRSDLVAVVRLLLELGVLARVAGSEDTFVRGDGDVLYDVHRHVLVLLTAPRRGASTVQAVEFEERLRRLVAEPGAEVAELQAQRDRRALTRRLVDDPVLHRDELSASEQRYLTGQRSAIIQRVEDRCGLVAEVRAEGIAMVDPDDALTDLRMPESGTDGHVALLVAEHLAGGDGAAVPVGALEAFVAGAAHDHRQYWRSSAVEPGAERELVAEALRRLEALGLVRMSDDSVRPRPALARYSVAEPTLHGLGDAGRAR